MIRRRAKQPKATWTLAFPDQVKDGSRERIDARHRRYLILARRWKKLNPFCLCCLIVNVALNPKKLFQPKPRKTTEVHHFAGRNIVRDGVRELDLLLYEPLWIPACSICHDYIHTHIAWARSKGLIAPKGQWNAFPKEL